MENNAFNERFDHELIKRMNEWAAPIADEINIPKQIAKRRKNLDMMFLSDVTLYCESCKKAFRITG